MNPPCRFSPDALQAQRPFLRVLALGLLLDEHHAEDAVQETMVQALRQGPHDESGLGPWMRTVCRNLALNLRRGNTRRRRRESLAEPPLAASRATPDHADQMRAWVVDAVVALAEPYREAILRRYYENQQPRDIADQLGVPVTTVYSRLQKGLQHLRADLEQRRRREGADRGSTHAALCTLAGWPTVQTALPALATWTSLALTAGLLLAALGWTLSGPRDPGAPQPAATAAMPPPLPAASALSGASRAPNAARRTAASPAREAATLHVRGRALDDARRPLPGARIVAHRVLGSSVAATADAEGYFGLDLPLADEGVDEVGVLLLDGARAAARRLPVPSITAPLLGTDRIDLGAIVLGPATSVRVQLRSPRALSTATGLRVLARLVDYMPAGVLRPSAGEVYLGAYDVDDEGRVDLPAVPGGRLVLRAFDTGAGLAGHANAAIDGGHRRIELPLAPGIFRRFPVFSAEASDRVAAAPLLAQTPTGETIDLPTAPSTDADGTATVGPLPAMLDVRVVNPDARWTGEAAPPRRPRTLQWTIPEPSGSDAPRVATKLAVFPFSDRHTLAQPLCGELVGNSLRVSGITADAAAHLALLPDGRRLRLEIDAEGRALPARVTGPRTVTVKLRDANDEVVADMPVHAIERREGPGLHAVATTDSNGEATLTGLHDGAIELSILSAGLLGKPQRQPIGVVAAGTEDAEVHWTFSAPRHVELRFLVDGEPRLPAAVGVATVRGVLGPVTEDPERAIVSFPVWANRGVTEVPVLIHSSGYRTTAVAVGFPGSDTVHERIALQRLAQIQVTVVPPADGEYRLGLEVRPPDEQRWWRVTGARFAPGAAAHRFRVDGVPAGQYRLRDLLSGTGGEPFAVERRGVRVGLDLAMLSWAEGQVTLPPGVEPGELQLTGPTGEPIPGLHLDRSSGRFRVRVPADGQLVVTAEHPRCGPPADGSHRARLTPGTPAELHLRRLCDVRFRVALASESTTARVRLRSTDAGAPLVDRRLTAAPDGSFLFAAPIGRFAARIDLPGRAPVRIERLELTGDADLGVLIAEAGECLAVKLLVRPEMLPPEVTATVLDGNGDEVQSAASAGRSDFTIRGLLPGRYRLRLRSSRGSTLDVRIERDVEVVAGGAPAPVAVDLRGRTRR